MNSNDLIKDTIKTVVFLIIAPGSVLFLIPYAIIYRVDQELVYFVGIRPLAVIFWLVGGVIILWCFVDFVLRGHGTPSPTDPPEELVVQGFYRYTRNPMYVGVMLVLFGHLIWFQVGWLAIFTIAVFTGFHGFVTLYEEPTLTKKFGDSYRNYVQVVPRWFPKIRKWNRIQHSANPKNER
jgi:protein-S-isoprenylcysteine O-methyltransferase Ste14